MKINVPGCLTEIVCLIPNIELHITHIEGDVVSAGNVKATSINGNVFAREGVKATSIKGDVLSGGDVKATAIYGTVKKLVFGGIPFGRLFLG